MTDPHGRPDICCMSTSKACQQHGPCSYLVEQFGTNPAALAPSKPDTSKLIHASLRKSGGEKERKLIVAWLRSKGYENLADQVEQGAHFKWYNTRD